MPSLLTIFLAALLAHPGYSCPHVGREEGLEVARSNYRQRATRGVATPQKTAITNVQVFNGEKLLPHGVVYIDGGVIVPYAERAQVIDGNGGVLLPGLIDAHSHPLSVEHLETFASYGVTTTIVATCSQ
ncbi:hypothetical protein B0H11DRAFT_2275545 [Mycena galericulata]|nr:hypothetical protein B0H11DRAFT_2275545 [Mycena galericulata]